MEDFKSRLAWRKERKALQKTLEKLLKANLMVELVVVGYDPYSQDEISPTSLTCRFSRLNASEKSTARLAV